ncbi:MAG: DUF2905 domain-containing protein [Deltaproteobacteria bacterium]|nr:DUF2905 domain-containing protein [Deltaproteobacteria bacterium]
MSNFGWVLIGCGIVLVAAGAALLCADKLPWPGRLPGDIHIEREHLRFYLPLTTSLLISALLSLVLYLLRR